MATAKQITDMVTRAGSNLARLRGSNFHPVPQDGFLAFTRTHPNDGRPQWITVFTWHAPTLEHADTAGVPHAYLCIDLGLDGELGCGDHQFGRDRLPLVDWPADPARRRPAAEQATRPWSAVVRDFERTYLAALDAPLAEGVAHLMARDGWR